MKAANSARRIVVLVLMVFCGSVNAEHISEKYYQNGLTLALKKQFKLAKVAFKKALKENPQHDSALDGMLIIGDLETLKINSKFAFHMFKGLSTKTSSRIASYSYAIKLRPEYALAYTNRGDLYREGGQYSKALSDHNRAIKLSPKFANAYSNRGFVHGKLGQYERAMRDLNKAIEIDPKHSIAYNNRAAVHLRRGDIARGLSDIIKAQKINPFSAIIQNNTGHVYSKSGRYDLAIHCYTLAIRYAPNHSPKRYAIYTGRGVAYAKKDQATLAIKDFSVSIKLNPKQTAAFIRRGVLLQNKGSFLLALADINQAIENNPKKSNSYIYRAAFLLSVRRIDE